MAGKMELALGPRNGIMAFPTAHLRRSRRPGHHCHGLNIREALLPPLSHMDLDHQLFVSRYLVALPKPEQLEQLIETDRAAWEQHHPDPSPTEDQP